MHRVIAARVTDALFGSLDHTLAEYIAATLGAAAEDYDLHGLESDLRATIGAVLPAGVRLEGEALVTDGPTTLDDVRDAVGWVDVHTVAVGHDTNGPGA